jgi:hypothetical protein
VGGKKGEGAVDRLKGQFIAAMTAKADFERSQRGTVGLCVFLGVSLLFEAYAMWQFHLGGKKDYAAAALIYGITIPTLCTIPMFFLLAKTYTASDENTKTVLALKGGTLLVAVCISILATWHKDFLFALYFMGSGLVNLSLFLAKDHPLGIFQPFRLRGFGSASGASEGQKSAAREAAKSAPTLVIQ